MSDSKTVYVPDIGGAENVDVIEVMVKVGDTVAIDDSLITLESDKASMEIPSPYEGTVTALKLTVGDTVSEGGAILEMETLSSEAPNEPSMTSEAEGKKETVTKESPAPTKNQASTSQPSVIDVVVPDIGGAAGVDVIELLVAVGEEIEKDASLITLESDKASMEIPSPYSGKVLSLSVSVGDKVSEGDAILSLETSEGSAVASEKESIVTQPESTHQDAVDDAPSPAVSDSVPAPTTSSGTLVHAGPAVRRLAFELGVDLSKLSGTGRKGRITKEDLLPFVKRAVQTAEKGGASGFALPEQPSIDFSKFGEINTQPLNKIKRLTGANVHRSWVSIPHVTQFDEADITDLEAFRKSEKETAAKQGYKITMLAFVVKALCESLKAYPQFNSSLSADGDSLIYKKYFNIGIAVDTPNGLVVPVIKGVDALSVADIAREMTRLSEKARSKGLMPADMSGGCITISSLGGIGGTAFTPIVNGPEVAILGLSRSYMKPIYQNGAFEPRLMLPLSLSYDHRVIDGAEAARFTSHLSQMLSDIRRVLLGTS